MTMSDLTKTKVSSAADPQLDRPGHHPRPDHPVRPAGLVMQIEAGNTLIGSRARGRRMISAGIFGWMRRNKIDQRRQGKWNRGL